jgi:hypothetical protein
MKLPDNKFTSLEELNKINFNLYDAFKAVTTLNDTQITTLIKTFNEIQFPKEFKELFGYKLDEFLNKIQLAIFRSVITNLDDKQIDIFTELFKKLVIQVKPTSYTLNSINLDYLFTELIKVSKIIKSDDIPIYIKLRLIYPISKIDEFIKKFKALKDNQIDLAEQLNKLHFDPALIYEAITTLDNTQMDILIKALEARLKLDYEDEDINNKNIYELNIFQFYEAILNSQDLIIFAKEKNDSIIKEINTIITLIKKAIKKKDSGRSIPMDVYLETQVNNGIIDENLKSIVIHILETYGHIIYTYY